MSDTVVRAVLQLDLMPLLGAYSSPEQSNPSSRMQIERAQLRRTCRASAKMSSSELSMACAVGWKISQALDGKTHWRNRLLRSSDVIKGHDAAGCAIHGWRWPESAFLLLASRSGPPPAQNQQALVEVGTAHHVFEI